jgi:amidohydrolase
MDSGEISDKIVHEKIEASIITHTDAIKEINYKVPSIWLD